jgi:two-component system LytT family response regulator
MLKAIIIDDEPNSCEVLLAMLNADAPGVMVMAVCHNGQEGLSAIRQVQPDIVFLDVEMPKMNGFEMLEQVGQVDFQIIFTTSYDQYALKAIRFSALDYLLKPIDREELKKAVQKAEEKRNVPLPVQLEMLLQKFVHPSTPLSKIALPTMEGLQLLPVESIISCESDDNYTRFALRDGKKLLVTRSLKEIEQMLEQHSFLRVHRSFLVNINEIEKYIKGDGGYLIMSDGSTVDVAQSRKELLLKMLKNP